MQIFVGDEGIDHAVGLHAQGPLKIVAGGLEALEVIGPVQPGGAVESHPAFGKAPRYIGMVRRALEQQMLEQMRHSRFAVVLVHGADAVGDINGHPGLGAVREQQHFEPVGQRVLVNSLHAGYILESAVAAGNTQRVLRQGRRGQGQQHDHELLSQTHRRSLLL